METKPIDFLPSDIWKMISRHISQKDRGALRATSRFFFKSITPNWDQYIIDSRRARSFSSSHSHTIVLTEAGEILGCGNNSMGQLGLPHVKTQPFLNKISDKTNIRAIATGNNHSLLLTEAGELWGCGYIGKGLLGSEQRSWCKLIDRTDILAIVSGGNDNSFFLTTKRELWGCGCNDNGQLGLGCRDDQPNWVRLSDKTRVRTLAVGSKHTLLLTEDGELWGCGNNDSGQLGIGSTKDQLSWVKLSDKTHIVTIAAGANHSLFLTETGEIFGCGKNESGQLGLGSTNDQHSWVKLSEKLNIRSIAAGKFHSLLLTQSDGLWGCGRNRTCQLGLGYIDNEKSWVKLFDKTPIYGIGAGNYQSVILTEARQLLGCGSNFNGRDSSVHDNYWKTWYNLSFDPYINKLCTFDELRRQRHFTFMPSTLMMILTHCDNLYQKLLVVNNIHKRERLFYNTMILIKQRLSDSLPHPWNQEFNELKLSEFTGFYKKLYQHVRLESFTQTIDQESKTLAKCITM